MNFSLSKFIRPLHIILEKHMKKSLVFFIATIFFVGSMPGIALATTTPASAELIAQLTAQITLLQTKIAELRAAQTAVLTSATTVDETLSLIMNLKEGMTSEEVKLLQALLASDSEIYPEKKITGYYGKLTTKAIMRFQKKHGLPQTGFTGPMTREKLNKLLAIAPVAKEDEDGGEKGEGKKNGVRFCLAIPPGHLIADGWKKHQGDNGDGPTLPLCKHIPPGILMKLGLGTTTPPGAKDTTAPTISGVASSNITTSGATIAWTTNELAVSKLFVATGTPVGTGTPTWSESVLTLSHSKELSGLSSATTYYFVIEAADAVGNKSYSAQGMFTTNAVPLADTTAPSASAIMVGSVTHSGATVTWNTDEAAKSDVYLSTTSPVATSSAAWSDANFTTAHSATLSALSASTTYYFVLSATDAAGNRSYSATQTFTTSAAPDTSAPTISAATAASGTSTSASVTWTTNEVASSKVYYSTTTPINTVSALSVFDGVLVTAHSMNLSGLTASTTYYAMVESKDAANNTATSSQLSFTTTP
jgi:peptidoglycan hydrolase-like protein with peptidoglycan-binding domain